MPDEYRVTVPPARGTTRTDFHTFVYTSRVAAMSMVKADPRAAPAGWNAGHPYNGRAES